MFRKLLYLIILIFIFIGTAGVWGWQQLKQFEQQPLALEQPAMIWIESGSNFAHLVTDLHRLGISASDWRWQWIRRFQQPVLKAGEYQLQPGITPRQLLHLIASGRVVDHRMTLIEGWTIDRLRQELKADPRLTHVSADWTDQALMEALGCAGCFAEGQFLPETYFFVRGDRDLDILTRAYEAMQSTLEQAWSSRNPELPIENSDELLVLASLVEMETTDPTELGQVAGVFMRRLLAGMRLQTDPTVVYGIESRQEEPFDGRIRRVHLRTDHPWNTYTRHGLPPTPIALPGKAAILAAAQPEPGDTYYFVARGDGTHQFSRTLAEHNRAVDRYIRGRN